MKKKRNRLISIVLIVLVIIQIAFFTSSAAKAQHSLVQMDSEAVSQISSLIDFVYEDPGSGLVETDFQNLMLGAEIYVYVLENNELVSSFTHLYPLYSKNGLIGHISVYFVDDTKLKYKFTRQYVAAVEELPDATEYAVVYDCNGAHLLTENGYHTVREYPYDETRTGIDSFLSSRCADTNVAFTAFRAEEPIEIPFQPFVVSRSTDRAFLNIIRGTLICAGLIQLPQLVIIVPIVTCLLLSR